MICRRVFGLPATQGSFVCIIWVGILSIWSISQFLLFNPEESVRTCFHVDTTDFGPICIPDMSLSLMAYLRFKLDGIVTSNDMRFRILRWLYARNVLAYSFERKSSLLYLVEPASRPPEVTKVYKKYETQMMKLLSFNRDDLSDDLPSDVMSFEKALEKLPQQWNNASESFIFFRDDPDYARASPVVPQRVQTSEICFVHAAAMLQHYLLARSCTACPHGASLDIRHFLLYVTDFLDSYLFDKGGAVVYVLAELLPWGALDISRVPLDRLDAAWLRAFGPAALADFAVTDAFHRPSPRLAFAGAPAGAPLGLHTMLVVGARRDPAGRLLLLVQNWWPHLQLVEIAEDYARASRAAAYYVRSPQTSARAGLRWTGKRFATA